MKIWTIIGTQNGELVDENIATSEAEAANIAERMGQLGIFYIETTPHHRPEVMLNEDETGILKQLLLQTWNTRGCMGFQELLGMEDKTEDWLNDVITDMTEKVGITPEETW